jgi:predicted lipoprotein with Yx(FWY)xxD motif
MRSSRNGNWLIGAVGALAAVTALAGCSGGNDDTGSAPAGDSSGRAGAVAVKDVSGVGQALVNASGKTLYFSDQEADGSIHCMSDCLGFWFPAPADAGSAGSMPGLAMVHRPDTGKDQLTYQSKPLYTFRLDTGPAQHNGHNLDDTFGNAKFTWHAATITPAAGPTAPDSSDAPPGDNYGY